MRSFLDSLIVMQYMFYKKLSYRIFLKKTYNIEVHFKNNTKTGNLKKNKIIAEN